MLLHTQTRKWSNGPEMNSARYSHGCTTISSTEDRSTQIIVVGGFESGSSVEILNVSSSFWFTVAKIPLEDLKDNSLIASNSLHYKLYTIGGRYSGSYSYSKAIYGLTYSNTWVYVANLTEGRYGHTSLNVAKNDIPGCS